MTADSNHQDASQVRAGERVALEVLSITERVRGGTQGVALSMLAVLACVYALRWAQSFLVPLLVGVLIALTLNPVMNWMERLRIPRLAGSSILITALICGTGFAFEGLRGEFVSILERLPAATYKLSSEFSKRTSGGKPTPIQQMQAVASELEKATNSATGVRVVPEKGPLAAAPAIKLRDLLLAGSVSAVGFVVQLTMVLFLVYFLLLSGDTFKRKLVRLAGPSLSSKKITIQILNDIHVSIQRYLFMLLVTNLLLAALMWIGLRLIGLDNAGAWALTAGLVHLVPYFGPLFITIATGVSAFMQFHSFSMMLITAGLSLAIATLVGTLVTTWMTGKIARMNPSAVFIGLLFWGWLWGVWGLLLGIPIIVIVKVIAEHVEELHYLAELLGD